MTSHVDYLSGYAGSRKFTVFEHLLPIDTGEHHLSARSVARAARKHLGHRLRRKSVAGT
ncbi:hypothetical protein [Rhodococcus sp. 24CO]|uniref:hypothetical protein n=1 Tax=Rhodococcus sp. 24CO TaxID=3117460 RepID=UPI003D32F712